MIFSSFTFLVYFLPAVLVLYYVTPKGLRNYVLLAASLIFYGWGEPKYVFLMMASIIVAYLFGMYIHGAKQKGKDKKAKTALLMSVIINVVFLVFFKVAYTKGFLPLPIGISFYTFQVMSYIIDVYRNDAKLQRNPFALGTYVTLFPQLIAGPIVRYQTVADQIDERVETDDKFADGVVRFTTGLAKKVILANGIGFLFTEISALGQNNMTVITAWIGAFAYTFQIYFDFSGYSDMAIGLGKMFGFEFLENFNYPYISKSITEFWRRWHISLSTWFRDYVYIPLGGNRKGKIRQYVNLAVVWGLTGLWHGFGWNFFAWGMFYYLLLVLEKTFLLNWLNKIPSVFARIYTMFFVIIGWVLFAIEDADALLQYIKNMFGVSGVSFADSRTTMYIVNYIGIFIIAVIACTPVTSVIKRIAKKYRDKAFGTIYNIVLLPGAILVLLVVSVAFLAGESFNPFLYFRF